MSDLEILEECPICMQPIERMYAMIDTEGETGKYHTACLDSWLKKSKNGILLQTDINSINIYDADHKLCNININYKEPKPFEALYNLFDDEFEEIGDHVCDHCILF